MSWTTLPAEGGVTSRLPSGVQVSRRAPGTSAHASAFQPPGSVIVCGPQNQPWRLAAGTLTVTLALPPLAEAVAFAFAAEEAAGVVAGLECVLLSSVPPQPASAVATTVISAVRTGPAGIDMSQAAPGAAARATQVAQSVRRVS